MSLLRVYAECFRKALQMPRAIRVQVHDSVLMVNHSTPKVGIPKQLGSRPWSDPSDPGRETAPTKQARPASHESGWPQTGQWPGGGASLIEARYVSRAPSKSYYSKLPHAPAFESVAVLLQGVGLVPYTAISPGFQKFRQASRNFARLSEISLGRACPSQNPLKPMAKLSCAVALTCSEHPCKARYRCFHRTSGKH